MKENNQNDERVLSEVYKYGYQARIIMSFLLAIDIFYKIIFLKLDVSLWIFEAAIFIVGFIYYIIRCTLNGLLVFPDKKATKKKWVTTILITGVTWAAFTILIYILFGSSISHNINLNSFNSLSKVVITMLISFSAYCIFIWILSAISKNIADKKLDE
jgi:uncharacterized membrane protein